MWLRGIHKSYVGCLLLAVALARTQPALGQPAPSGPLAANVAWTWGPTAGQYPSVTDVWSAPAVARIFDTNGDNVVDQRDDPSVIFISGNDVNISSGLGTSCQSTGTTPTACHTGVLRVLNGRTGAEQFSLNKVSPISSGFAGISVAVGDVIGNGSVQIAAVTGEGYVVLIGSNTVPPTAPLAVLRTSNQPIPLNTQASFGYGGGLAIADMDGDGFPEIAYGGTVFGTSNGTISRKWLGSSGVGGSSFVTALSTFAHLGGGAGLQLLAGNTVYNALGSVIWSRSDLPDGFNAVADFDGDGSPEVVLVASGGLWILDGATGATRLGPVLLPGTGSGGPPVVADFDGDGKPEIGIAKATVYSVVKPDFGNQSLSVLWQNPTHDLSSSTTGSIAFDFEGTGRASVLYADECFVWVFDGATGAVRFAASHTSFTGTEEPVVADVDGDGHADIVAVSNGVDPSANGWRCLNSNGTPVQVNGVTWQPSATPAQSYRGISVYASAGTAWAAAPAMWNEHTYHVSNISDGTGTVYPALSYGAIPPLETPNWSVPWLNDFRRNVRNLCPGVADNGLAFYLYQSKFGSYGSEPGQFNDPRGVAVDGSGRIIVADAGRDAVELFDPAGAFLFEFGQFGSGPSEFDAPSGVAVSGSGGFVVADRNNHRIEVFDAAGGYLFELGGFGAGPGQFSSPEGVAVGPFGRIVVADTGNDRIQAFDSSGGYLFDFGSTGSGPGQFAGPAGVAVDGSGRMIVADTGNSRIQVFDSTGTFLFQFGTNGTGTGQFQNPLGAAVDGTGRIAVADTSGSRIQVFSAGGAFLSAFGSHGAANGQFADPAGVAFSGLSKIIVVDSGNARIQAIVAATNAADSDGDGAPNCLDSCPLDSAKTAPGVCGCNVPDTDGDGDGVADCVDNCPSVPNPDQTDSDHNGIGDACDCQAPVISYRDADGDGFGDPAISTSRCGIPTGYVANNTDCDDTNGAVWSAPVEVTNLRLDGHGSTTLTWDSQASVVGPGVTYDILRGDAGTAVGSAGEVCEGSAIAATTIADDSIPPPGVVYRYLVRGHNTCAEGTYGATSDGTPRISSQCEPASCTDLVKNGNETDVDCGGGACPPCSDGQGCNVGSDCQSGVCSGGQCAAAACNDGVKNGNETDVDCGGGTCPPCSAGHGCSVGSDCQSGACSGGQCAAAACDDGVKNGNETDVDCGGGTCPPCSIGHGCNAGSDCQSGVCSGGLCTTSCADGVKDGTETDVDCGGGLCPACGTGQGCNAGTDCQTGVCSGSLCAAPSCSDGVKNGTETGIDCGGGTCPPCPSGQGCSVGGDCQSGVCSVGLCAAPSCTDGVRNGTETGVDCGGGACPACGTGRGCVVGSDCQSGVCSGGLCAAPSCTDGVRNGTETGVDCGGGNCPACGTGQGCVVSNDCLSHTCIGGLCRAPSCNDGVKNGNETDGDCGGGTCPRCSTGRGCNVGNDCQSGVCSVGLCRAPSCNDGVKNGNETDVDCGGGTCPSCADGAHCVVNSDCTSGVCSGNSCVPSP